MSEEKTCKRCGTPLTADSPEGLCPRCLMALNLETQTEAPSGEVGPGGTQVVPPPPAPPPLVSDIAPYFPQLEILECLGRGGMGVVYRARQPKLDRFVALKLLAREKAQEPRFAERFQREARALARLSHPNIVAVYDFGETAGLYYLLMEFVDGVNLRELIRGGKMTPEQALTIVPPICEALQYAHQQGIVHRDIKPENILVDKQSRVKIADFGIAKMLSTAGPVEPLTAEQQAVGTPHYMAPEQVEKPQTVDHRADIYSLGVVFYEMLTGELPLGKFQPPSQKVHVDVRLDQVVLHALEKEPERRYQHASEVKTDVETIARQEAPGAGSPPPGQGGAVPPAYPPPAEADVWQQVKGPATGLMVTGILNWVAIPLVMLAGLVTVRVAGPGAGNQVHAVLLLVPLAALVLGGLLFLAGLKMKRLEAYVLAVVASVLAILATPGNLIGLPIGIWALVVLSRREVRRCFGRGLRPPPLPTPQRGGGWKVALVIVGAILLLFAVPVTAIFASLVVPAYMRAKTRAGVMTASAKPPKVVVVHGTVTDAVTGHPIQRARVADDQYGAGPTHISLQTWTDAKGRFVLHVRPEEHTLVASAPGYETKPATLRYTPGDAAAARSVEMNFQLLPATNTLPEAATAESAPVPPAAPAAPQAPEAPASHDAVQRGCEAWRRGDYQQALQLLLPAAQQGNPIAQHRLGVMYVNGQGVAQDFYEAMGWFRKAAEQGQGESQFSMGLRWIEGKAVGESYESAARWFQLAANQGVGMAASMLAQLYAEGRGVRQDYVEAYKWLLVAGDQVEPSRVTVTLNDLKTKLTADQLAEAERRAREFVPRRLGPADP